MKAASYVPTDGTTKVVDYDQGRFSVDGCFVAQEQVLEWDTQGTLLWSSPMSSEWAAGLPAVPIIGAQTGGWYSRLPVWAKILFVLVWPVSIPYALVKMWKRGKWPVVVRAAVSFMAATTLLFLTLFSVGMALAAGGYTPPAEAAAPAAAPAVVATVPVAAVAPTLAPEPAAAPEPEPAIVALPAEVVRVIDGDTAVLKLADGTQETVRFIGVDTPEVTGEPDVYGAEASAYTAAALPVGLGVFLENDVQERDVYGRLLAYVWLARPTALNESELRDKLFNAKLALDGYAQQLTIQPDSKYADYFTTFVAEARTAEVGLWSPEAVAAAKATETPVPAPKPKPKPKAKASSGPTVYITDTGEKYHTSGCQYLRRSKHAISLKAAKSQGYTPCSRCGPPS